MSYSDQLLTGRLEERCHPLNLIDMFDMFAAALGGEVHINRESFTHHRYGREGQSMLASMNQYSVCLDIAMSCFY